MLRNSSSVFFPHFPSSDSVFNLVFFAFQQFDFDSISSELLKSYSPIQNKNRPYDPSSLIRLFFILNLLNLEYDFYKSKRLEPVLPKNYLDLCGFTDQLPCYTTYFYFKQRFDFPLLLTYLNRFLVSFLNAVILLFKDEIIHSKGIVIASDSKPVAAYGNLPLGPIHSYNKALNSKRGFKIFWMAVVYPFYFPFFFSFHKASANDNPLLSNAFKYIKCLDTKTSHIFFAADKGFDSLDTIYNLVSMNFTPFIRIKKTISKITSTFKTAISFVLSQTNAFCQKETTIPNIVTNSYAIIELLHVQKIVQVSFGLNIHLIFPFSDFLFNLIQPSRSSTSSVQESKLLIPSLQNGLISRILSTFQLSELTTDSVLSSFQNRLVILLSSSRLLS